MNISNTLSTVESTVEPIVDYLDMNDPDIMAALKLINEAPDEFGQEVEQLKHNDNLYSAEEDELYS